MYHRGSLTPYRRPAERASSAAAAAAAVWITVSVGLCFGYYGTQRLTVGPGSSRTVAVSSVAAFFSGELTVSDAAGGVALFYGFVGLPELNLVKNWTTSQRLSVGSYGSRGFSLWLNRGSSIKLTWAVSGAAPEDVNIVVLRGESKSELLGAYPTRVNASGLNYGGEAAMDVKEDDSYYIGAANGGRHPAALTVAAEVSSTVHDVTPAASTCTTTAGGRCKMKLLLGRAQYAVLDSPAAAVNVSSGSWSVELSYEIRLAAYMGILGTLSVALWLIVRYLHACGEEWTAPAPAAEAGGETEPLTAAKAAAPPLSYGAMEEGTSDSAGRSSSEDLYDGKICVICYDVQRDCFFTPCGHSVTCYPCAKRIMEEEEGRACPICRRLIHKVRWLPHY